MKPEWFVEELRDLRDIFHNVGIDLAGRTLAKRVIKLQGLVAQAITAKGKEATVAYRRIVDEKIANRTR